MTIEEKLKEMLVEHGVSERVAIRIVEKAKTLKCNEAMTEGWQHDLENYPPSVMLGLWLSVKGAVPNE